MALQCKSRFNRKMVYLSTDKTLLKFSIVDLLLLCIHNIYCYCYCIYIIYIERKAVAMIDNYCHQNGESDYIQETIAAVTFVLTSMTIMIVSARTHCKMVTITITITITVTISMIFVSSRLAFIYPLLVQH